MCLLQYWRMSVTAYLQSGVLSLLYLRASILVLPGKSGKVKQSVVSGRKVGICVKSGKVKIFYLGQNCRNP